MRLSASDLEQYLTLHGWTRESTGSRGSLWRVRDDQPAVGVLADVTSDDLEWHGIVERVADRMEMGVADVRRGVQLLWVDEPSFSVPGTSQDVALDAGEKLFRTARIAVRSCATTSQGRRPQIAGHWSRAGDRLIEDARFEHTRPGSYEVPVRIPLGPLCVNLSLDPPMSC